MQITSPNIATTLSYSADKRKSSSHVEKKSVSSFKQI